MLFPAVDEWEKYLVAILNGHPDAAVYVSIIKDNIVQIYTNINIYTIYTNIL